MMKNTEDNQNALLAIIDQLFVFIKDPQDPSKKLIVINPKLDNKLLGKLIKDSRDGILKLYTTCEEDFFRGLQIFEALVEKQIMDTSTSQIKKLQENVEQTISLEPTKEENNPVVKSALENSENPPPTRTGDANPATATATATPIDPVGPKLHETVTPEPKPIV
jgi:hypothetical protein